MLAGASSWVFGRFGEESFKKLTLRVRQPHCRHFGRSRRQLACTIERQWVDLYRFLQKRGRRKGEELYQENITAVVQARSSNLLGDDQKKVGDVFEDARGFALGYLPTNRVCTRVFCFPDFNSVTQSRSCLAIQQVGYPLCIGEFNIRGLWRLIAAC
jgi:hypothetical protein